VSHKLETLRKIISGGQTGVGRAALDFEIEHDIPHGGWCPKDRKAEDRPGYILAILAHMGRFISSVLCTWALANIALFSPIQFHNWLWPMQFAYFLPYAFLALCFCTLYARIPALPKFVLAAVFALAGNFSFVQGNLIWPAALPVILFAPDILRKGVRRNFAMAWVVLGALAVTLYFRGLEHNSAASEIHAGAPSEIFRGAERNGGGNSNPFAGSILSAEDYGVSRTPLMQESGTGSPPSLQASNSQLLELPPFQTL
jgi:hypothetical protein